MGLLARMQTLPSYLLTYHGINRLNNRTLDFVKLHLSNSESVHEENQEQEIWNQENDIKYSDGTEN